MSLYPSPEEVPKEMRLTCWRCRARPKIVDDCRECRGRGWLLSSVGVQWVREQAARREQS